MKNKTINNAHINVEESLKRLQQGEMLILADDENREDEGDFVMAAEFVTPSSINFMATEGRGLICAALTEKRIEKLKLEKLNKNSILTGTNFCMSVDAIEGCTTDISAFDRAKTILKLINPECKPEELVKPGHIFPLLAHPQGLQVRKGHTEGIIELCKLAGLFPAGVICEILNPDGSMARVPSLKKLALTLGIGFLTIKDIENFNNEEPRSKAPRYLRSLGAQQAAQIYSLHPRSKTAGMKAEPNKNNQIPDVKKTASTLLPTKWGPLKLSIYNKNQSGNSEDTILIEKENPVKNSIPLVRLHSECFTGDILKSLRCDCGPQLDQALSLISREENGLLIYLRQEGRGIGLKEKIKAYNLQNQGADTVDANLALGYAPDLRNYGEAAAILRKKGYRKIKLLTNNPDKIKQLEKYGIEIIERIPLISGWQKENLKYLKTKAQKMGHIYNDEILI